MSQATHLIPASILRDLFMIIYVVYNIIQNDTDIMEAMEGIEDIAEEQLTIKSIAKLSDSEMVLS